MIKYIINSLFYFTKYFYFSLECLLVCFITYAFFFTPLNI